MSEYLFPYKYNDPIDDIISRYKFIDIYYKFIADTSVLNRDDNMCLYLQAEYLKSYRLHLTNLNQYAPKYFMTLLKGNCFMYSLYIFTLIFIREGNDKKLIPDYNDWCNSRYEPNIPAIIIGPRDSTSYNIEPEEKYKVLLQPFNISDIVQYNTLAHTQYGNAISKQIDSHLVDRPNVYYKSLNESEAYTLCCDSKYLELEDTNTLYMNIQSLSVSVSDNMEKNIKHGYIEKIPARPTTLYNIKATFSSYNTLEIKRMFISDNAYSTPLNALNKVYVVFDGVNVLTNYTDEVSSTFKSLRFSGKFNKVNDGYEFLSDVGRLSYNPKNINLDYVKVYITDVPGGTSTIVNNKYTYDITKNNIFNRIMYTDNYISDGLHDNMCYVRVFKYEHNILSLMPDDDEIYDINTLVTISADVPMNRCKYYKNVLKVPDYTTDMMMIYSAGINLPYGEVKLVNSSGTINSYSYPINASIILLSDIRDEILTDTTFKLYFTAIRILLNLSFK